MLPFSPKSTPAFANAFTITASGGLCPRPRSGLNARIPSLHADHDVLRQETSPNGEDNSTRCPGVQHHHWQHDDVGLESSARDGVPWQQRALDIGKHNRRRASTGSPVTALQ
jgi:hypothetical protein